MQSLYTVTLTIRATVIAHDDDSADQAARELINDDNLTILDSEILDSEPIDKHTNNEER